MATPDDPRASDPPSGGSSGDAAATNAVASRIRALVAELEAEALRDVPSDERALASGPAVRRAIKRGEFRALRPISRRSDRLTASLARLSAELADRLIDLEAHVRALEAGSTTGSGGVPDDEGSRAGVPDSYYWRFETAMRGSTEAIDARLRQYERFAVRWREEAGPGPRLWIDVGAGRGEFAEILREWGWDVLGVETSLEAFEACREKGIDAVLADGIGFLEAYGGRGPTVVSAIQVIEHLPAATWLRFFRAARRALVPGGRLLVETINPLNVASLSSHFFADVTHTWPMHPEVGRLMAEEAGFDRTETVFLNDDERGNAQDFALIAEVASADTEEMVDPAPSHGAR
jgi:SAM-dependent methyltransferase